MPSSLIARCRPTYARWLNERSLRPPMSVTRPTLMGLPLDAVVLAPLELLLGVLLLLLLLLEPQAAMPIASAAHPASANARDFIFTCASLLVGRWVRARAYSVPARPRSLVFRASSQNAASMAVAVIALRRTSSKPI